MWVWRPQKGLRGSWLGVCGFWNDPCHFLAAEREKTFARLLTKNSQYRPEPAQEAAMAKTERNQTNKNAWLANINSMSRGKQLWALIFQLDPVPLLFFYSLQCVFPLQSSSSVRDYEEAANRGRVISGHSVSFVMKPLRVSFSRAMQSLCLEREGFDQPCKEIKCTFESASEECPASLSRGILQCEALQELSLHIVWQGSVSYGKLNLFALIDTLGLISCPGHQPLLLHPEDENTNPP